MKKRAVYVFTNGCPENRIDCAYVENKMREHGWMIAAGARQADLILFSACGLTNEAEKYSLDIIYSLQKIKQKSAKLMVFGCLPKINQDLVQEFLNEPFEDDPELLACCELLNNTDICNAIDINRLSQRINDRSELYRHKVYRNIFEKIKLGTKFLLSGMLAAKILKKALDSKKGNRETCVYTDGVFPIKVASGCLSRCSFCAVKLSRGALQSKRIGQVIDEFNNGLRQGYRKIYLVGTDVGSYGRDMGCTLVDLLREMIQHDCDYEIMLRNIHPVYLIDMLPELLEILESRKITTICSAVESGSNAVLERMRRRHTIEQYSKAVLSLKERHPFLKVRSQILVGFPGESDADFAMTEALLDILPFDFVEIYKFQPRKGTDAYMYEQVPQRVINKRYTRLLYKSFFKK